MIPLSFAQQRLWFAARPEGSGATDRTPMALRLDGELDVGTLEAALADVIDRHEVLRTVFAVTSGRPRQRVLALGELCLRLETVRVAEQDVAAMAAGLAAEPFDPAAPVRARLLTLGPLAHVLVLVPRYIAAHNAAAGALAGDIGTAYAARSRGLAPDWGPPPAWHADDETWWQGALGDAANPDSPFSRQVAWWRGALAGAPSELALAADRPRPAVASHRGHAVRLEVPAAVHRRLAELARAQDVTVLTVVQAALAVLLSKLGAGEDIPSGAVADAGGAAAPAYPAGFFVNVLVTRTDLSGNPEFTEILSRMRDYRRGALEHQEMSFERLAAALAPDRWPARHPLFQVMVAVGNDGIAAAKPPGLRVTALYSGPPAAPVDLDISLTQESDGMGRPGGLGGVLTAAADLFDPATAEAIAGLAHRGARRGCRRPGGPASADPGHGRGGAGAGRRAL